MDEERRRAQANMASTADIQGNPILPGGHPRGHRTRGDGRGEAEGAKNQDPKGFLKPAEAEKAVKILLKMGHSTHSEKRGRGSL